MCDNSTLTPYYRSKVVQFVLCCAKPDDGSTESHPNDDRAHKTGFTDLNQDCLVEICHFLNLHNLTMFKRTSRSTNIAVELYTKLYMTKAEFNRALQLSDFENIAKHFSNLKVLKLGKCTGTSLDETLCDNFKIECIAKLKVLEVLHMISFRGIDNQAILTLASSCLKLKKLVIKHCDDLWGLTAITKMRELKYLSLAFCDVNVTDYLIIQLASACTQIEGLNLARCYELTDSSISVVAQNLHALKTLKLTNCSYINDDSVIPLIFACLKLQTLYLPCRITDHSIYAVSKNLHTSLTKLSLFNCYEITDDSISEMVFSCHSIEELDLTRCKKLTDRSVFAIALSLPNLRNLNLVHCENVTSDSLVYLLNACAQLVKLAFCVCKQQRKKFYSKNLFATENVKKNNLKVVWYRKPKN